jgi:hypothetical protein
LNHQLYRSAESETLNQDYWLLNFAVARKFFANQRGELELLLFDALDQNTDIRRNITDAYVEDVQAITLQRYFMLTFTYTLRQFTQGSMPERPQGPGRFWRPE